MVVCGNASLAAVLSRTCMTYDTGQEALFSDTDCLYSNTTGESRKIA